MINSRLSRDTKLSAFFKNEIIKREFERFKKMIKSKTLVNSRSSRRDFENVETKSKSQRFVVDLMSFIIFAFFVTFALTFFVIFTFSIIFAFSISFASSIIFVTFIDFVTNSIFDEMNRNVLIRLLTILISSLVELSNVFVVDIIAKSLSIRILIFMINFVVIIAEKSTTFEKFSNFEEFLARKV
jgi:hypothetical protein